MQLDQNKPWSISHCTRNGWSTDRFGYLQKYSSDLQWLRSPVFSSNIQCFERRLCSYDRQDIAQGSPSTVV